MLQVNFILSAPWPWNRLSLKDPGFFYWRIVFRKQVPGIKWAHYFGVWILLENSARIMPVWTHVHVYTFISTFLILLIYLLTCHHYLYLLVSEIEFTPIPLIPSYLYRVHSIFKILTFLLWNEKIASITFNMFIYLIDSLLCYYFPTATATMWHQFSGTVTCMDPNECYELLWF